MWADMSKLTPSLDDAWQIQPSSAMRCLEGAAKAMTSPFLRVDDTTFLQGLLGQDSQAEVQPPLPDAGGALKAAASCLAEAAELCL